ncbi:Protein of unknown function [Rosenbergiella nectarea]|uniref:DUF3053 domain-containing protein n=1 Tax=Rosenbergiella nectarea TaxID=988801 RepID=A0A1H9JTV7_9GAMM|nr:DUF3053 domain-containing protein [Rosenbergiella nectarea]SEQ90250.1 Protein of unknown function [Rosenbergiella nectarea]
MASGLSQMMKKVGGLIALLLVVCQLTACGDKDADQRKAFGDFLQNTVMRSGTQLPALSENQKKSFGNYVGDYAILYGFSQQLTRALNEGIRPVTDQLSAIHTPQDYLAQRDALRQAGGALNVVSQQVQNARNLADSSKSSLKLPEDLQKVYEDAYKKTVTTPADNLQPILPELQALTQAVLDTADFLQAQDTRLSFNNNAVQFPTQDQVNQYNTLVGNISSHANSLSQAKGLLQ